MTVIPAKEDHLHSGYKVADIKELFINAADCIELDPSTTYISCFDSRSENPVLGVPGGDMA